MRDNKKDDRFEKAILRLDADMDRALTAVKGWFADLVLGKEETTKWEVYSPVRTPEQYAESKRKLDAALKRWEERKARERAAEEAAKKTETIK